MRQYIKWFLSVCFFYSQLFHLIRLWNNLLGKRLTILMFHRVIDNSNKEENCVLPTICISRDNFESLIRFISKYYKVISVSDYLKSLKNRFRLPYNGLILSFDDGYKEILENALPLLQEYGLPAVLFVPTAMIDNGGSYWWDEIYSLLQNTKNSAIAKECSGDPRIDRYLSWTNRILSKQPKDRRRAIIEFIEALQNAKAELRNRVVQFLLRDYRSRNQNQTQDRMVLTWDQIRHLNSCGIEIGSHTVNHQFLPTVSDREATDELTNSQKRLEARLKSRISCFSYPGGKYNENTVKLVEDAGYTCAFTTDQGINTLNCNHYKLKRINISDEEVTNPVKEFSKPITARNLLLKW